MNARITIGMILLAAASAPAFADTATPAGKVAVRADRLELAEPIYFDTGKATIKPASHAILDAVVATLAASAALRIEVGVHTDARGAHEFNLKMSDARAAAIKQYLVDHGADAQRVAARGYGETRPLCNEPTAACWAKNRRVELLIVK